MSGYDTIESVQEEILWDAANHANYRFNTEFPSFVTSGEIFRAEPHHSSKGGLCLSVDEGVTATMTQQEIVYLHKIGLEAIRRALVDKKEIFVGLILSEARQGRNYFDRFVIDA